MMSCEEFENDKCAQCNCNKIIVAAEKKCKYVLNNLKQEKICKIRIDGCYLKEGKRCDYLILTCNTQKAFFVELKGNSYLSAVDQILTTIEQFGSKLMNYNINARIVLTKVNVPNLENNPKVNSLKKLLRKKGGTLDKKTIVLEETI